LPRWGRCWVSGRWFSALPLRGPLWQLALVCVATALAFSALGLLVASRARTIEAVSGLMNFIMMPMWVFSGVFFSANRFPAALQPFIQALPLTAAINALRANMLEGAGVSQYGGEMAILVAWIAVSFLRRAEAVPMAVASRPAQT